LRGARAVGLHHEVPCVIAAGGGSSSAMHSLDWSPGTQAVCPKHYHPIWTRPLAGSSTTASRNSRSRSSADLLLLNLVLVRVCSDTCVGPV
jgi:hypothetical protein